jgi:hypothetical protein
MADPRFVVDSKVEALKNPIGFMPHQKQPSQAQIKQFNSKSILAVKGASSKSARAAIANKLSHKIAHSNDMLNTNDVIKGTGVGLAKTKTATWHFRPSPVTGKIGPDTALRAELKAKGIFVKENKTPLNDGIDKVKQKKRNYSTQYTNNKNGKLAEDELLESIGERKTKEQVVHSNGIETGNGKRVKNSRVVDIKQKNLAGDIHEVKVGEVTLNKAKGQLAKDAQILEKANGFASSLSKPAKLAGKVLRPLGMLVDGVRLYDAAQHDHLAKTASEVGGGWAGAFAGMAIGATAGAGFFGIGALPGAIIGGIAGAFGGEWAGGKAYSLATSD